MVAYTITTTRTYSNIDGASTEVLAADTVTVNNGGDVTVDTAWSGSDGSITTGTMVVNIGGIASYDAGVTHTNGSTSEWQINEGGYLAIVGTTGSHVTIQGAAASTTVYVHARRGGSIYCDYVDFIRMGSACFYADNVGYIHARNCTSDSTTTVVDVLTAGGGTKVILDTCSFGYSGKTNIISDPASGTVHVLKDCTFLGNAWISGAYSEIVHIIGDTTLDGSEIDHNNDSGNFVTKYAYYKKATINDTNTTEDAYVSSSHPSQDANGRIEYTQNGVNIIYESHWGDATLSDASGDCVIYELYKVIFDGTIKYISDGGQAASGDNQKYTRMMSKNGFTAPTTNSQWAGTASSFSLATATAMVISGETLTDYAINTRESTTASCVVTKTPTIVGVRINNEDFRLPIATGSTYSGTLNGMDIGTVAAGTVVFYASKDTEGDLATDASTLTVSKTTIDAATTIHDLLLYIRDFLATDVTDPISGTRRTNSQFIMTDFTKRPVDYPCVTIQHVGSDSVQMGMAAENQMRTFRLQLDIWARASQQRDTIYDDIAKSLRDRQFSSGAGTIDVNLFDLREINAFNRRDPDNAELFIKTMEIEYRYTS